MIKYFRFTYDYCLYDISYANLQLLQLAIPPIDFDEEEAAKEEQKQQKEVLSDFFSKATF